MKRLKITELGLGVKGVERLSVGDERGSLTRLFCADELSEAGWIKPVAQVNAVENIYKGTVRGLHYQAAPHAETKLLLCLRGDIHDVVVDVRRGSPTFLQHVVVQLSAEKGQGILIPPGFAHGYQCLTGQVSLLYFHDMPYAPNAEGGLHVNDPRLGVTWPLPIEHLSARDEGHALIDDSYQGALT